MRSPRASPKLDLLSPPNMGNQSRYGVYKKTRVRLTVFRLNGKVGLALDQEPIWIETDVAYDLADQLMDQADQIEHGKETA